ncbi:MAG: protein adenylyltransferase SelO, partial [Polyangiaceae bacterium]
RRDIQLKGAGRTPFSRGGDGRAALGPVLREYLVSEAMAALGVPTTRALAAATTGEPVAREVLLPGAVITRVAASHMRIGTFQFLAARQDREGLATLASYALARHYPSASAGPVPPSDAAGPGSNALVLLERVIAAQASLVARWLGVGFIHGVMNTDNTSISGETIDYGPCAFLDEYDPDKKFSSIDSGGRYAFANQPRVMMWNLTRLAEALLPLFADDEEEGIRLARERLERFPAIFERAQDAVWRAKLGLSERPEELEGDQLLATDLLARLAKDRVDFTLFFRRLCASAESPAADAQVSALFADASVFPTWAARWRERLGREDVTPSARAAAMRRTNPVFIPRNHRVEEVITAAVAHGDFGPFETLLDVVTRPFDDRADRPDLQRFAEPPRPEERVKATFCGT